MKSRNNSIYVGIGILKNLKIATFLFSQLSKFGILIKTRISTLRELNSLDNIAFNNYKFLLSDCCINYPDRWEKYIHILPSIRFILLYDNITLEKLRYLQRLGFVFIQASSFSVAIIANQILNVVSNIYSNDFIKSDESKHYKFQESSIENIRIILPNHEFFIFTKLSKLGFLQYKDFSIKLSDLESNIMYELVSSYKWASNSLVKFPLLTYRQVTNTVSRLRSKFKLINFPLTIKNDYARGYYLDYIK